jgi:hypothetical protein
MLLLSATALLAATAATAAATAGSRAPPPASAWNDTACHSPLEPNCETCLERDVALPGSSTKTWLQRRWTGNCSGCEVGVPYGPSCGEPPMHSLAAAAAAPQHALLL